MPVLAKDGNNSAKTKGASEPLRKTVDVKDPPRVEDKRDTRVIRGPRMTLEQAGKVKLIYV